MHPDTKNIRTDPVNLIHHAANCEQNLPPGSLSALAKCLSSGASFVEIDIIPLADGSFALLHEPYLDSDTDGEGNAPKMMREQIEGLHYVVDGSVTNEKIGFLEDALDILQQFPTAQCLQLDFKPFSPVSGPMLENFLSLVKPVEDRIQVTSPADWAIRIVAKASPGLSLGFDPLLYLDLPREEAEAEDIPPFRLGAYSLMDDHPLSVFQWGSLGDYFAIRAEGLLTKVPRGCDWYIRAEILEMALNAGFDWIDFLHQQGSKVDGWTIDVTQPDQIALAQFLVDNGIDKLTTDTPSQLAAYLSCETIF